MSLKGFLKKTAEPDSPPIPLPKIDLPKPVIPPPEKIFKSGINRKQLEKLLAIKGLTDIQKRILKFMATFNSPFPHTAYGVGNYCDIEEKKAVEELDYLMLVVPGMRKYPYNGTMGYDLKDFTGVETDG